MNFLGMSYMVYFKMMIDFTVIDMVKKIGLSSNFSGEDLVAACEMLVGFLNRFGPLSLRQIQIEANKYGDYHDQTIVTELARNKNIVRLDRGLYGLIGVHIDLERLIIAEFISIVFF